MKHPICIFFLLFLLFLLSQAVSGEEPSHIAEKTRFPVTCDQTKLDDLLEVWQRVKSNPTAPLDQTTRERLLKTFNAIPNACLTKDFRDEIRAAIQWFGVFPCRSEDLTGPTTIILSPEIHNTPFAKTQLTKFFEAAKSRNERLVIEHTLESQVSPSKNFPGVDFVKNADGELAWSFWHLYKVRWGKSGSKINTSEIVSVLGAEPVHQTLRTLKRPLKNKEYEQLLADVEAIRIAVQTKKKPSLSLVGRLMGEMEKTKADGLLELVYEAHLKRLTDPRTAFLQVPPDLKGLRDKTALEKLLRNWRDRNLAFSAAEAACGMKKGTVRLHMGIAHTAGIYEILRQMIAASQLESKVRLVVDRSVLQDPDIAKIAKSPDADYKNEFEQAKAALLKITQ